MTEHDLNLESDKATDLLDALHREADEIRAAIYKRTRKTGAFDEPTDYKEQHAFLYYLSKIDKLNSLLSELSKELN